MGSDPSETTGNLMHAPHASTVANGFLSDFAGGTFPSAAVLSRYRPQTTKMCIDLQVRNLLILHSYDSFFPFPISAVVRAGPGEATKLGTS
jgi:hypothetical protein